MFKLILAAVAAFGGLIGAFHVTGNLLVSGIAAGAAFVGVLAA
jgi:hypothetical protein